MLPQMDPSACFSAKSPPSPPTTAEISPVTSALLAKTAQSIPGFPCSAAPRKAPGGQALPTLIGAAMGCRGTAGSTLWASFQRIVWALCQESTGPEKTRSSKKSLQRPVGEERGWGWGRRGDIRKGKRKSLACAIENRKEEERVRT